MNKSKLPTNHRQIKKLLKDLDSGELQAQLERHKERGNDKGVAKAEQLLDKAKQLQHDLKNDADWKAELDKTRRVRTEAAELKRQNTMARQQRKYYKKPVKKGE